MTACVPPEIPRLLYCSFCGKSQHEVRKLIAGPRVFICDGCVELCMEIIKDEAADGEERALRESEAGRLPDMRGRGSLHEEDTVAADCSDGEEAKRHPLPGLPRDGVEVL